MTKIVFDPVVTTDELRELSPRGMVALTIRAAQRFGENVQRSQGQGEPLLCAMEFCANRKEAFEHLWREIKFKNIPRYHKIKCTFADRRMRDCLRKAIQGTCCSAAALSFNANDHYLCFNTLKYPYDSVGLNTAVQIVFETLQYACEATVLLECKANRKKVNLHEVEIDQEDKWLLLEFRRDYEILRTCSDAFESTEDPLGGTFDFNSMASPFGALWSTREPTWYKPYVLPREYVKKLL